MIDYLIIGSGLAGIAFAEIALQNQKTVFIIDSEIQSASKVSAGIYNPVVLKRFTPVSDAEEQLIIAARFYASLENKLHCAIDNKIPVLRLFHSIEEQNNWFVAADKIGLAAFLNTELISKKYKYIDSPFDFGQVNFTGYVNVGLLLQEFKKHLQSANLYSREVFYHAQMKLLPDGVQYKGISAKRIIFAEGFGVRSNPFFNDLPLDGTKGEIIIIKAPLLDLDAILNTSVFILPLGNDVFKVGATYNWEDKTDVPTESAKSELLEKLNEVISCAYEVVDHIAGVRPTVKDRKPLIGTHRQHQQIHLLNGLGTRGVTLAPIMAKQLFDNIEFGIPIPKEIDIRRYYIKNGE